MMPVREWPICITHCKQEMSMAASKTSSFTWSFDEGRLTVKHLDKAVSLGRYATRELAAKAAAVYIRKQSEAKMGAVTTASPE